MTWGKKVATTGRCPGSVNDRTSENATELYDLRIAQRPVEPVTTLRGAGVEVDIRRVGRLLVAASLVTLAVLVVVFSLAGIHRNAQVTQLRDHGVVVEARITGCFGLLGGSGSNQAGYVCRGAFSLDGRRYNEVIPGDTLYPPGTSLRIVTDPGDPALDATLSGARAEHSSARVFILPAILLLVLLLALGGLLARRGRRLASPERPVL